MTTPPPPAGPAHPQPGYAAPAQPPAAALFPPAPAAPGPYPAAPGRPAPGQFSPYAAPQAPGGPGPYAGPHPPAHPGPPYPGQAGPYAGPPVPGQGGPHAGQQYWGPAQQPTGCRICGAPETSSWTVRGHQGLLVVMRFVHIKGPLCRTCGRAAVRSYTTMTLSLGWWSPFSLFLFTPLTLLNNLVAYLKFGGLPAATPVPGRQQLDAGKPVLRRPAAYVVLVPLLFFTWMILQPILLPD
ncbi:hypothetical protein ACFV3R_04615 [Streptomyces sp. NPDC059740]|uniref:hypothetical protein n=1 Tax=Streptomyces sp. NPDC059740 TaxID=3346926 RepID=UPI0036609C05